MRSNPFATRYTRPGALPYLFPPGQSAESLVQALRQADWWGEIIGPHGSGKSSLVAALLPELTRQGRAVVHLVFRSDGPASGTWPPVPGSWTGQTQVVVDGYEQLSWWQRRKLKNACRRAGAGLLITTHLPGRVPTLYRTEPTVELALQIVQQLVPTDDQTISEEDVRELCRQHPSNLREVLFGLYDLYRRRTS